MVRSWFVSDPERHSEKQRRATDKLKHEAKEEKKRLLKLKDEMNVYVRKCIMA